MSTVATDVDFAPANDERQPALPLRADTLLGVCEGIGQDLGINPNFLRVPFAALMLWNPPVVIASYLGLGCVVALSRWMYPAGKTSANAAEATATTAATEQLETEERLAA
jgi:phage shock protein PspC (stress-responsive transcriptional regulator)